MLKKRIIRAYDPTMLESQRVKIIQFSTCILDCCIEVTINGSNLSLHEGRKKRKESTPFPLKNQPIDFFFERLKPTNSIELNSGTIPTACHKAITTIASRSDETCRRQQQIEPNRIGGDHRRSTNAPLSLPRTRFGSETRQRHPRSDRWTEETRPEDFLVIPLRGDRRGGGATSSTPPSWFLGNLEILFVPRTTRGKRRTSFLSSAKRKNDEEEEDGSTGGGGGIVCRNLTTQI